MAAKDRLDTAKTKRRVLRGGSQDQATYRPPNILNVSATDLPFEPQRFLRGRFAFDGCTAVAQLDLPRSSQNTMIPRQGCRLYLGTLREQDVRPNSLPRGVPIKPSGT